MKGSLQVRINRERKLPWSKIVIYTLLALYTAFLFFPMLTVLITSFVPAEEIAVSRTFVWWPENFTMDGYKAIFSGELVYGGELLEVDTLDTDIMSSWYGMPYILKGFVNTLWITLVPLVVGLLVSGLSAYAYSKMQFPGRNFLFKFSFILSSVPLAAFGIIAYMVYSNMGWTDYEVAFLPLVIPGLFGSISVTFFLRTFFDGISDGLIEAAELDGMNVMQIFFRIILPLATPAFVAQFIFGFVGGYNSYTAPLLYLVDKNSNFATLQLVLSDLGGVFNNMGMDSIRCAIAVVGMLPLIIIYIACQRFFTEGIAMGGIKE